MSVFLHNALTQYMACVCMLVPRKEACLWECLCMHCINRMIYVCETMSF